VAVFTRQDLKQKTNKLLKSNNSQTQPKSVGKVVTKLLKKKN